MFTNAITLTPSSGVASTSGTAVTFDLTSIAGGKSIRSNAAAPLDSPSLLVISHQTSGSKSNVVDRHLVRLDKTFPADGDIPEQVASVYMVIVAPRNGVTAASILDMTGALLHMCNNVTNLTKILNNEP